MREQCVLHGAKPPVGAWLNSERTALDQHMDSTEEAAPIAETRPQEAPTPGPGHTGMQAQPGKCSDRME